MQIINEKEYIKTGYKCKTCGTELLATKFSNHIVCINRRINNCEFSNILVSRDYTHEFFEWGSTLYNYWLCNWVDKMDNSKPLVKYVESYLSQRENSMCINGIEIKALKEHIKKLKSE